MAPRKSKLPCFKITQRQIFVVIGLFIMVVCYIKFVRPQLEPYTVRDMASVSGVKTMINTVTRNVGSTAEEKKDQIIDFVSDLKRKFK